ncbi:DUF5132 domain-containing protein [Methylocystis parvus]|uniref:DUF5132 domain-containing protein n=2 Tax=Methylocystis parvus TaxID=134 RepID=A0A6B8MEB9_9HYPH|nr:DUF5132 domain-containing protein [Methylocystis parvus]
MKPWGFALGVLTGAAATFLLTRDHKRARPVARAALKAAMMAYHEARTQSAELMEAAEDLFAEAKAEATSEIFAAMMAKGQKAASSPPRETTAAAGPQDQAAAADPVGDGK